MTNTNRRLWDMQYVMESKKPEEPSILPESVPNDIRQIHQPPHPMQPPHIITQPPPPPPPPAEQNRIESHAELSTSSNINMMPEHKTNLSQPPPNYPNYGNRVFSTRTMVPPNYNPHFEHVDITMPPPTAMPVYSNIELECCEANKEKLNKIMEMDAEIAKFKKENPEKKLELSEITRHNLMCIKNEMQAMIISQLEKPTVQVSERNAMTQNMLPNSMSHYSNANVSRQQITVPNQTQNLYHLHPNIDVYRTQTGMSNNQVSVMTIPSDNQYQLSGMINRPNQPMIGNQMLMGVAPSPNISRPPNPPIMQPPVGQYSDNHTIEIGPNHYFMNTNQKHHMQQQMFMPHNTGQFVSTPRTQDNCHIYTNVNNDQSTKWKDFLDKVFP